MAGAAVQRQPRPRPRRVAGLADMEPTVSAGVGLAWTADELPGTASTVVDLGDYEDGGDYAVVRAGAIPDDVVAAALSSGARSRSGRKTSGATARRSWSGEGRPRGTVCCWSPTLPLRVAQLDPVVHVVPSPGVRSRGRRRPVHVEAGEGEHPALVAAHDGRSASPVIPSLREAAGRQLGRRGPPALPGSGGGRGRAHACSRRRRSPRPRRRCSSKSRSTSRSPAFPPPPGRRCRDGGPKFRAAAADDGDPDGEHDQERRDHDDGRRPRPGDPALEHEHRHPEGPPP